MQQPMFSVVIPLYNRAHLITRTLQSVLSQTYQDFEVIVVDDGSKDNPGPVIAALNDPRIKFIRQANAGGSAARNTGIDAAQGRYIAFLDSDDEWLPEKLKIVQQTITTHSPAPLVMASFAYVNRGIQPSIMRPSRPPVSNERIDEFLCCAGEPLSTITLVVARTLAQSVYFNKNLTKWEDPEFLIRCLHHKLPADFYFIPEALAIWNDIEVTNRLSQTKNYAELFHWFNEHRDILSEAAQAGFLANILSYEVGWNDPLKSIKWILNAWWMKSINSSRAIHSTLRAFLPPAHYRKLVNIIIFFKKFMDGSNKN